MSQTPEAPCSRDGHAADVNMSQILYFKGARRCESHFIGVCVWFFFFHIRSGIESCAVMDVIAGSSLLICHEIRHHACSVGEWVGLPLMAACGWSGVVGLH